MMNTGLDRATAALDWILGVPDAPTPEPSLRKMDMVYTAMTGDWDFHGVFDPDRAQLASVNTGTFSGSALNALNKIVMMHYDNMRTYRWFEPVVEVLPHDGSTHEIQLIYIDGVDNLPVVAEGGAYTEAKHQDAKESFAFDKRGVWIGITLEMIRRSDIMRIRAQPRELVKSCVRTRSARVASIFTANAGLGPTMAQDNKALFHADHGNLSTAAFARASWAAARQAAFKQKLPGTKSVSGLRPRFALLPDDLYDTALKTFGYGSGYVGLPNDAGTAQEPNPYGESRPMDRRPIPISVPEFTDANNWAYLSDMVDQSPLKMAYANRPGGMGHPPPELFRAASDAGLMFSNDTMPIKIRDWFGYGVGTWIGIGKSNVA